ncbi:hNH endonuclease [Enterobacter hormaechei]|uniref:hNH endonuclease n=1 Tax=Enterobacter TaxID=547 RepID=UPI0012B8BE3B|nr:MULTISPECIES: hNH endonuclease [Enterobacter]EKV5411745.1 hNH endonuclease [Enterobacter hormaechei]EKW9691758.1 hNH endonuclease [Enterobacter hormaechei]QLW26984.1 hNH endonuclease [Enterobacter sp. RHBSTW-00422]
MKFTLKEMNGLLNGKCLPSDLIVGETLAEYLVRKFSELEQRLIESERYGRQTDITIDNLEMKLAQMAAENAGLNTFVDALLSIAWQGGSADGADIQDLALKHGLLRQEVYSADEHETLVDDPGNFEDGDPVYFRVETPATDAFLAEVRAQGVEMFAASLKVVGGHEHPYSAVANEFAAQLRKGVQS